MINRKRLTLITTYIEMNAEIAAIIPKMKSSMELRGNLAYLISSYRFRPQWRVDMAEINKALYDATMPFLSSNPSAEAIQSSM